MLLLIQFCNRTREGANQIADEKCENSLQIKGIQRIPSGIAAGSAEEPGGAARARSGSQQRLMQLEARTNDAVDAPDQHHQAGFEIAVQGDLVHTVQGDVHKARNAPFHHHRAAH